MLNQGSASSSRRRQRLSALHLIVRILASTQYKKSNTKRCWIFRGGGGRIRFSAEKPRRLQVFTEHLPRAGFRIRPPNAHYAKKETHQKVCLFFWWGRTDSNHRSDTQQIYSLSPLATRELPHIQLSVFGAGRRTRTPDLLITNQLLYQLSYTGGSNRTFIL